MKITKLKSINKFNEFVDNLSPKDNIALMHDTDADGISAAAIVSKALAKENFTIKLFLTEDYSSNREITNDLIQNLKTNKINKFICVDIALEDFVNAEKIDVPVLIIDHHQSENRDSFKNFTIYKPSYVQDELADDEVCAANLAYQLFSTRVDLSDLDWIVSIGIIGDYTFKKEKEFLDKVVKKYNFKTAKNIYDSTIGIAVQHITFANCMRTNIAIEKALKAILESTNLKETIKKLKEFEVVDKEIKRAVKEFDKNKKELFEDLTIYVYQSPFKINSPVSSIISGQDIHKTIITLQETESSFKISARRQDKTKNMGLLLRYATKDLKNSNGGGHVPAAGGQIDKKDLDLFIDKLKTVYTTLN